MLFGNATGQLVQRFNTQYRQSDLNWVDDATAEMLNKVLAELGALDAPPPTYSVQGSVRDTATNPIAGLIVCAFDLRPAGETLLGETTTNPDGQYQISFSGDQIPHTSDGFQSPNLVVRAFSQDAQQLAESDLKPNAGQAETVDLAIDSGPRLVVRGQLRTADGRPQAGVRVRAYDKDMRHEQLLGEIMTDSDGNYEISYFAFQFRRAEKGSADLVVGVLDAADQELARSQVIFNAREEEIVALIAPGGEPELSEFDSILQQIQPLLVGQGDSGEDLPIDQLTDSDITFLANDTGIVRERIAWLVRALTTLTLPELVSQIPSAAFYGWFRGGMPTELDMLLAQPTAELLAALKSAALANYVPHNLLDHLNQIGDTLDRLKAARTLEPAPEGKAASLGDLLNTLPQSEALSTDAQITFARLRAEHGDTDALWQSAEAAGLSSAIPALKRTFQLGTITDSHPSLISVLQARADTTQPGSTAFLMAVEPIEWIELVFEHGVPPASGLDRDAYIDQLQLAVEREFAGPMLRRQFAKKLDSSSPFPTNKVLDFLNANPDLDIRATHIEPLLVAQNSKDDELRIALLQVQSIHALTNTSRETVQLLDLGYRSATQIVSEGYGALGIRIANQIAPERSAQIFGMAQSCVLRSIALGSTYGSRATSVQDTHVINVIEPASADTLAKYPSLSTLFGDLDYCACPHCRSVLGPAAYLVDLMHILQRSPLRRNVSGALSPANLAKPVDSAIEIAMQQTVLGVLLQRRPDLADLELSCENTDTEIPYIDLVLEILENAVALPLIVDPAKYASIDIPAAFAANTIPQVVLDALAETDVTISKAVTFTEDEWLSRLIGGIGAAELIKAWIITDGSRRWCMLYVKPQMLFQTVNPSTGQAVLHPYPFDMSAAVAALDQGRFNAELENALAQGLPIAYAPQIQKHTPANASQQSWTARYTRGLAIQADMATGTVKLFKLNNADRPFKTYRYGKGTIETIKGAWTDGATAKINWNVAQLLEIPPDETYQQIWNADRNWWELSVTQEARFMFIGRLAVRSLTFQNSSVRADLVANPENRNPSAYKKLSESAVFPWALPFDLWLEETRAFLAALSVPRSRLIDLARPVSRFTEAAATLELLGCSKSEGDIIGTAGSSATPWVYWGLTEQNNRITDHVAGFERSGAWYEVLTNLSMLLQQSGLSYREYLDFRQTRFADPKSALWPPNECQTSKITLVGLAADEFAKHLNQIHIFTRLWRRSGWSMRELDLALAAFGGLVTSTLLQDLAGIKRLQTMVGLPAAVLISCIDQLGIEGWTDHTKESMPIEPALFDSIFQRPALQTLSGFDTFSFSMVAANTTLTITERADFIAASLGVTAAHITTWIAGTANLSIEDRVTPDSLSRLYAAAALCRALEIKPEALPDSVALLGAGLDVFRTLPLDGAREERTRTRASALLTFVERIGAARRSNFDFETLSYLLRHQPFAGTNNQAIAQIEQRITQILTALRAASQIGAVLDDVSAENLARQLTRRGWYAALIDQFMRSEVLTYQPGASVDIVPPLADEPTILSELQPRFNYRVLDKSRAVLSCTGSLSSDDFRLLRDLGIFSPANIDALSTTYKSQLKSQISMLARFLQIIALDILPRSEQVVSTATPPVISGAFAGRLQFELLSATTGRLRLMGWLTDSEKSAFVSANPWLLVDATALQAQAEQAIPEPPGELIAEAERLLREPDALARVRAILLRVASLLELDGVTAQVSTGLGLAQQIVGNVCRGAAINGTSVSALLTDPAFLRSDRQARLDRKDWPEQFAALELLGKIATIVGRLAIRPEQWDWIQPGAFAIMNVLTLPTAATPGNVAFDAWRRLVDLCHVRDVLPNGPARLSRIATALSAAPFTVAPIHAELADAFNLNRGEVEAACAADLLDFRSATPDDYRNPSRLLELAQLLQIIKSLGTTAGTIALLIKVAPDHSAAQSARALFAANTAADTLSERLQPIANRLRDLQRNALVAYLINRDQLADADELFDHYLIDVQMGSCMRTSRIKQAISSVQLFVQRCLLNLEPGVRPDSIDAVRWQWMKSYRVWEANRKIFLYPENWIEPSLRDDKSELFRALERELQQSEISHETALVAYRTYLDKLSDLANMTVVSMFEERLADRSIVHVVGRGNSQSGKHYYRQWKLLDTQAFGTWTAWEEIAIPIASEHVLVFLFANTIYVVWSSITSSEDANQSWKITMNLAKRTTSGWVSFKKSRGELTSPMLPFRDARSGLAFKTRYDTDRTMAIEVYGTPDLGREMGLRENDGPRAELILSGRDIAIIASTPNDPWLDIDLRALWSYTNQQADGSTTRHYVFAQATMTITVSIVPPNGGLSINSAAIDASVPFSGRVSQLIGSKVLSGIDKIKVEITSANHTISKVFAPPRPVAQPWNLVTWHEDFVFDLPSDLPWYSYFSRKGSFILKEDESLESQQEPRGAPAVVLTIPSGADPDMSGYRELDRPPDDLMLSPGRQVLTETPGRYFIAETRSLSNVAPRKIWAYRDDRFALLFWTGTAGYRIVPFSSAGIAEIKSNLAQGKLAEAARLQLPGAVESVALPIGSGIEVQSPATGSLVSVTQIGIDFEKVPTSSYNWEVFFHIPLLVATQLSQAQRFEEAQRWFHLIFDPTTDDPDPNPSRYWRFLPFREQKPSIDKLLEDLAKGDFSQKEQIEEWAENPFLPHLVARQRVRSYKFAVVLKYLENLLAWGDRQFRRDTIESINEATQLYVLAARILGRRPAASPKQATSAMSYREIQSRLDYFSNAWLAWEPLPLSGTTTGARDSFKAENVQAIGFGSEQLFSLGSLYFCIPGNEKLSEYWDMVEDRLFKIRHCMNIEGIERRLPLFEPPIDPALLVRATAAGLDLTTVLSDLDTPLPLYRFNVMLQKALEICAEVRALGSALLSALEKKDAEALSLLRSRHEIQLLTLVRQIKEQQIHEAEANLSALRKTRHVIAERYLNYQRLMGKQTSVVPAEGEPIPIETATLKLAQPNTSDTQGVALTQAEAFHLQYLSDANDYSMRAGGFSTAAAVAYTFPDISVSASASIGVYSASVSTTTGGSHIGHALSAIGTGLDLAAKYLTFQASRNQIIGGYERRYEEWRFQSNMAARELEQIDKQIIANGIRQQIAERELANHDQQIANSIEVEGFLRDKYTSQELYSWMGGQISSVYFRAYQLAHAMAKRAERAFRFELGLSDSKYIQFGYWDSLKKGLMAGEMLGYDLKRMEAAYLDQNKREYEITKHISLLQIDPLALVRLREAQGCEFSVPEVLFDLDFPGHYLRRIKAISLTIPCVTGPYSGVPCTLTLLRSEIRHGNAVSGGYARNDTNDPRFTDSFGSIQSIVTSSGQNDSGLFEANLRDERYLPFEGQGAISSWRIELPTHFKPFDYTTISDVILHVRFTAREGGAPLRQQTVAELSGLINSFVQPDGQSGLARIFSLRHEFPTEWYRFLNPPAGAAAIQTLTMTLAKERFPYLVQDRINSISSIEVLVKINPEFSASHNDSTFKLSLQAGSARSNTSLELSMWNELLTATFPGGLLGSWTLAAWLDADDVTQHLEPNAIQDILLVCRYTCL